MNTNENNSGTLKFSNPVSTVKEETKHNTLNDIKDRIAKEEGFKNWTELTWEVNYTSYELLWGKVTNELVKENQELKAALSPFVKLAENVIDESNNHLNRVLYAFNQAEITYQDLRNAIAACKTK